MCSPQTVTHHQHNKHLRCTDLPSHLPLQAFLLLFPSPSSFLLKACPLHRNENNSKDKEKNEERHTQQERKKRKQWEMWRQAEGRVVKLNHTLYIHKLAASWWAHTIKFDLSTLCWPHTSQFYLLHRLHFFMITFQPKARCCKSLLCWESVLNWE